MSKSFGTFSLLEKTLNLLDKLFIIFKIVIRYLQKIRNWHINNLLLSQGKGGFSILFSPIRHWDKKKIALEFRIAKELQWIFT